MSEGLAFRLAGVRRSFKHFTLQDVDLELPRGSIMGFVGPNGAGKSTTIRILMGLIGFDDGEVEVLGRRMPEHQIWAKRRIGYLAEDMGLYRAATVGWHERFVRSLYPTWDDAYATRLVERFRLLRQQKVRQLSHGQRIKLALLLALARRPELLILDEPTTGLDPVARREVLEELQEALEQRPGAVFFSSHQTQDVEEISDRVAFIDGGRILEADRTPAFLDRWRRLRVHFPAERTIELPADCRWLKRRATQGTVASGRFSDDVVARLAAAEVTVESVEPMSLEEIFAVRVAASREAASTDRAATGEAA